MHLLQTRQVFESATTDYLDDSYTETGLLGQGLPHFSARLRAYFEGGFEGTPLLCSQDRSGPFWTPPTVLRSGGRHQIVTRIFAYNSEGQPAASLLNSLKINCINHIYYFYTTKNYFTN
jgi:hypothetical protein